MIDKALIRTMEIKVGDEWVPAEMSQLEEGDIYRMFEPDGTPSHDGGVYKCMQKPHVHVIPVEGF